MKITPQEKLQIFRDLETSMGLGSIRALELFDAYLEKILQQKVEDMKQKTQQAMESMNGQIKSLQLRDGKTPRKFIDYFTPTEIEEMIKASTPQKGKDYLDESEMESMHQKIADRVMTMMRAKEGVLPVAGKDYPTFSQVKDMVTEMFVNERSEDELEDKGEELLENVQDKFSAVEITGEDIVKKINSLPLNPSFQIDASHISNLPKISKGKDGKKYLHGGGVNTISSVADGSVIGTINGVNKTFVFPTTPTIICVDGGRTMTKTSADGTVNWTGGNTVVLTIAPNFDLFGF